MKKMIAHFVMVTFLSFAAFADTAENPSKAARGENSKDNRIVIVKLQTSPYNAGAYGRATFVALDEKNCEVEFFIAHLDNWILRPIHIYTYIYPGSCKKLGEKPAYEMNNTTIMNRAYRDVWKTSKGIPVSLASLLSGNYAVVVRSSPADGSQDLFCGNIEPSRVKE